jgi:hypothetical protein
LKLLADKHRLTWRRKPLESLETDSEMAIGRRRPLGRSLDQANFE